MDKNVSFQNEHQVESIAFGLVREYLFEKGFAATYVSLESEVQRNKRRISNRPDTISELRLEKLVRKNKVSAASFTTLLEILINHRIEKISKQICSKQNVHQSASVSTCNENPSLVSAIQTQSNLNTSFSDSSEELFFRKSFPAYNLEICISEPQRRAESNRESTATTYSFATKPNITSRERRRHRTACLIQELSNVSSSLHLPHETLKNEHKIYDHNDINLYDLHEISMPCNLNDNSFHMDFLTEERPITVDEACALRHLLFGNTVDTFGSEWTRQSFKFRSEPLSYSLFQKKSGPCGVLAAVQAHVIYELLFGFGRNVLNSGRLRPKLEEKKEALARAITSILWQAGENQRAILAYKHERIAFDLNVLEEDGILECLRLKYFESKDHLLNYLFNFISEMMKDSSSSCVTFLYSVILSHGIDSIKQELDYPENNLIGEDGYCSQEIVNLILVGRASPNLFDGDKEVNFGGEETTILHGIPRRSKIGLLVSQFDNQEIEVGRFYRYPFSPIWVIFGDHHYTVLFSPSREILDTRKQKEQFDLFYCDCMSRANEEICFAITPDLKEVEADGNAKHYVLRCIYTRWPFADLSNRE